MRSRFSAYARGDVAHILRTTHPAGPHWQADAAAWSAEVARFCARTRFVGLTVHGSSEQSGTGFVSFTAHLEQDGRDASFGEKSRFERVDGQWLYHSGEPLQD